MLSTRLNLLPPQKKELLEKLVKFIFFKEMIEMVLLVASLLSVVLLWSWFALQIQFNDLSQSSMLVSREYSHYNQDIRKLNNLVKQFNTSNKNYSPLTPKILEVITKLPVDIKLNSLSIDRKTNTVIIAGIAKTREALLSFQSSLKDYSWLDSSQTPTSQLFQKENVTFEIKAKPKNLPALVDEQQKKPVINRGAE